MEKICAHLSSPENFRDKKLLVPKEKFFPTYSREVTRRSEHNREGKTHHMLGERELTAAS
jgi:hypothetical protein